MKSIQPFDCKCKYMLCLGSLWTSQIYPSISSIFKTVFKVLFLALSSVASLCSSSLSIFILALTRVKTKYKLRLSQKKKHARGVMRLPVTTYPRSWLFSSSCIDVILLINCLARRSIFMMDNIYTIKKQST